VSDYERAVMATYSISKAFSWQGQVTEKVAQVCRMFGLTADRLRERRVVVKCELDINAGDIVYITGPSGAGKSVLLRELERSVPPSQRIDLARIRLPRDKALVDCIEGDFVTSLRMLSKAGLSDVYCVLNQPANLSDGQKYRLRLAMALAAGKKYIFADEFCANLDRITAAVIAYNVRKFASRAGVTFILAASHDDILLDLVPDVLVVKEFGGATKVIYKKRRA
jgi:ABC-type ATPase with predicted acetyltransferase domain